MVWNVINVKADMQHTNGEKTITDQQYAQLLAATTFAIQLATGQATLLSDANVAVQLFTTLGNNSAALGMQIRLDPTTNPVDRAQASLDMERRLNAIRRNLGLADRDVPEPPPRIQDEQ